MKKILCSICIMFAMVSICDYFDSASISNSCYAAAPKARNNGTYSLTGRSVMIYTESGHSKGSYAVYRHYGKLYINFSGTWICIQGKRRFFCNGNWYVIK